MTSRALPLAAIRAAATLALLGAAGPASAQARPNIVLILADDMGFSDLGSYGGEIRTPHLDNLADQGVRFTQFYNGARCCPSRASLLTGLHPHEAGQGRMETDEVAEYGEGYAGGLNRRCVTLAEALRASGYATSMVGKWHVVTNSRSPGSDRNGWPLQRGFERFFGMIHGSANYWTGMNSAGNKLVRGNDTMTAPAGFYATDNFADTAVKYIRENFSASAARPLFLYAAFSAPHYPLHAHKSDIDRYRTRYTGGWEALRAERHARLKRLGVVDPAWPLSPPDAPDWNALPAAQRDTMALKMAVYAAMVDRLDQNVGKIVAALREKDALANTLIVFLSDNGATAEGGDFGYGPNSALETQRDFDLSYGRGWAQASNTPFPLFKKNTGEGGISTPFIAHWPARIPAGGGLVKEAAHLVDIMPTFLEAAEAPYPREFRGRLILPLAGRSLLPAFAGGALAPPAPLFWEHENNKAVRDGKWKLVANGGAAWSLFDMAADRTERTDLAAAHPERVRSMDSAWRAWALRAYAARIPGRRVPTRIELVAPAAGERVMAGAAYVVRWGATTDSIRNVSLAWQADGGAWKTLAESVTQDGNHAWSVPAVPADRVRLRIASLDGKWSDTTGNFALVPATAIGGTGSEAGPGFAWRRERGGVRFTGLPEDAVLRVYDARGRLAWEGAEHRGLAFWSLAGATAPGSEVYCVLQVPGPAAARWVRRISL